MHKPIVIFTGPSASGKTTLCDYLVTKHGFVKPSTCTTRSPRQNEGPDSYIFLNQNQFKSKVLANEMLEYVENFGYYYGSPTVSFELDAPIVVAMTASGAEAVRKKYPHRTVIINLSISPITMVKRIRSRSDMSFQELKARLMEIKKGDKYYANYFIDADSPLHEVCHKIEEILSLIMPGENKIGANV